VQSFCYDANIRNLVEKASGEYCFFMGNDDLMCPDALENVAGVLERHPDVGLVLKSYAWFAHEPEVNQVVRYFVDEHVLAAGKEAIRICFRRSGYLRLCIVTPPTLLQQIGMMGRSTTRCT
jgi:abequosyltransferase